MFYEKELAFLLRIFQKCNMPIAVIDPAVYSGENSENDFSEWFCSVEDRTFYKMTDAFQCNYLFFRLPETEPEQLLLIGPYINESHPQESILEQAEALGVSPKTASRIEKRYGDIIVLSEDSSLFAALDAFFDVIWGEEGFSYYNFNTNEEQALALFSLLRDPMGDKTDVSWDMERMEKRYAYENQFMDAVSRGQTYKAELFLSAFTPSAFEQRTPDTLRNAKNYMIIMNTLLRKAAERGGVHPIYLDQISSGYAREIEGFNTVKIVPGFMKKMFESYCRLVRKHTAANYSPLVKKVIMSIESDLSADLSLSKLAGMNGVSAGYLSTCFKQETGQTFVAYVTTKRIELARHLLQNTRLQVQTIAQHCGVPDMQYFSKVFKKYTGMTPRQYREDACGRMREKKG